MSRNIETKETWFYSPNPGATQGTAASGLFSLTGFVGHNQSISSNLTDICRMLPVVPLGVGKFERVGDTLRPISLTTRIQIAINPAHYANLYDVSAPGFSNSSGAFSTGKSASSTLGGGGGWPMCDWTVVVYVLTHKSYKDYPSLNSNNVFAELLDNGQGATNGFGLQVAPFTSYVWHADQKINDAKYIVHKKYKFRIRKEMFVPPGVPPGTTDPADIVLNTNSHAFSKHLTYTMTQKQMPAVLRYDADTVTASSTDPTNFAPFWVVGCYSEDGTQPANGANAQSPILVHWNSNLKFKDA